VVPLHGGRQKAAPEVARPFDARAREDALTGLHGHPWFADDVRGASRRRRGTENPWVAVAAIEGLATIAARLGPIAADGALRAAAVCVHDALRSGDKLARIGESRLGLIVDAPFGDEAMAALERIGRSVRTLASSRPEWRELSLSIGVAPLWHRDPEQALDQALEALARARRHGGGAVRLSTSSRPAPPRDGA